MMVRFMLAVCLVFALGNSQIAAQHKMTPEQYILTYRDIAVQKMQRHGIPASITLAQGLLESGNGGSRLAVEGNNHFGIKCKGSWTGAKIYHDDDEKGECFRKYPSPEMSYEDHSVFLTTSPRYAQLFTLKPTDYKGWAYGLKAAGYATNPQYAPILISLIERYGLDAYDRNQNNNWFSYEEPRPSKDADGLSKTPDKKGRRWGFRNGVRYVISVPGDSWGKIARNAGLTKAELFSYNDFKDMDVELRPGMALYVRKKRNRYLDKSVVSHVAGQGETLHSISQKYGVRMRSLQRKNPTLYNINDKGSTPREVGAGQQVRIR